MAFEALDRSTGGPRGGDQARLDRRDPAIGRGRRLGACEGLADELVDPGQLLDRGLGLEPPDRSVRRPTSVKQGYCP